MVPMMPNGLNVPPNGFSATDPVHKQEVIAENLTFEEMR
jgi:hypothetical protein